MSENSVEFARAELLRIAEMVDLEIEDSDFEEGTIKRLLRAIQSGRLTVDDKGQPTLKLRSAAGTVESVTFYQPKGKAFMGIDEAKKDRNIQGMFNSLAIISRTDDSLFSKMDLADTKICTALGGLFFS